MSVIIIIMITNQVIMIAIKHDFRDSGAAARSDSASFARSAGLAAYRVTSTRRLKLNKSFLRAGHDDVQCVVDDKVDLGRTSTPELACDAVTSGTLSAGDLSWCCELADLLFSWCSAGCKRDLQIMRPLYLSCSATFVFSSRK